MIIFEFNSEISKDTRVFRIPQEVHECFAVFGVTNWADEYIVRLGLKKRRITIVLRQSLMCHFDLKFEAFGSFSFAYYSISDFLLFRIYFINFYCQARNVLFKDLWHCLWAVQRYGPAKPILDRFDDFLLAPKFRKVLLMD